MDRYSRMVAWLKVLLPLSALALLSTLFLLSRNIDPMASVPFADAEIQDRLRTQQVTEPFFSGSTQRGDQISFSAQKMGTPSDGIGTHAEGVTAKIDLASGAQLNFVADLAQIDLAQDHARLSGDVEITTSAGYVISTQALSAALSQLNITSPGAITGRGPFGNFSAGTMTLTATQIDGQTDAPVQLVFTNRVKVIYDPKLIRE